MPPEARQGMLRGARATTGVEGQDVRLAGNRAAHTSRGSFINYYDDLGISTTPEGAGQIRKEKSEFQGKVKEQQAIINQKRAQVEEAYRAGQGQLASASSKIPKVPGLSDAISSSWNKTRNSFVNINVVDSNNNIEGTYKLPKEVAESLAKQKGLYTNYLPDQNAFYIATKSKGKGPIGGKTIGKELHEKFVEAEKTIYDKWYESALPQISKSLGLSTKQVNEAKAQLASASGALSSSYSSASSSLAGAEGVLTGLESLSASQWKDIRDKYQKKKETIASIFSNLSVEKAKEKE